MELRDVEARQFFLARAAVPGWRPKICCLRRNSVGGFSLVVAEHSSLAFVELARQHILKVYSAVIMPENPRGRYVQPARWGDFFSAEVCMGARRDHPEIALLSAQENDSVLRVVFDHRYRLTLMQLEPNATQERKNGIESVIVPPYQPMPGRVHRDLI